LLLENEDDDEDEKNFLLGKNLFQRKKEPLFETAENVFRKQRSQMSGNPV